MRRIVTTLVAGVVLSLTAVVASAQGSWTDGPLLPTPRSEI
jgi:hypothetical protein